MRRFLIILFSFVFFSFLHADFVSVNQAEDAAVKFLSLKGDTSNISLVHTEYVSSTAMFYIFDITGGGHIIIAADDMMEPIRAYVPLELYNPNTDNPGFLIWKEWNVNFFIDSILSTNQTTRKINTKGLTFLLNQLSEFISAVQRSVIFFSI